MGSFNGHSLSDPAIRTNAISGCTHLTSSEATSLVDELARFQSSSGSFDRARLDGILGSLADPNARREAVWLIATYAWDLLRKQDRRVLREGLSSPVEGERGVSMRVLVRFSEKRADLLNAKDVNSVAISVLIKVSSENSALLNWGLEFMANIVRNKPELLTTRHMDLFAGLLVRYNGDAFRVSVLEIVKTVLETFQNPPSFYTLRLQGAVNELSRGDSRIPLRSRELALGIRCIASGWSAKEYLAAGAPSSRDVVRPAAAGRPVGPTTTVKA